MEESFFETLAASNDPEKLLEAAATIAASHQVEDLARLSTHLVSASFLDQLDPPESIDDMDGFLRVGHVLEALAENRVPEAHELLVSLTRIPAFDDPLERADCLIEALGAVRPAPPAAIRFWDEHCQPEDGFTTLTIATLVENRSAPALGLLERKFADPLHPDVDKIGWMRSDVLFQRNDLGVLRSCQRMLQGSLPENLRPAMVECLFDHRYEWYGHDPPGAPPERAEAKPEALGVLREIGNHALAHFGLADELRQMVERVLGEIDET